ncbi:NAD-dependent epimerase/dehydratase family protein [Brevundimonas lenta]|uniref:Nucleoside-diphosphate-sugar epimerase n=1 Tax=Brevundimonas lenta TaxID=424796 RepID=A0A7W6NPR8_9CAUL|nr:NAD-dependent epimerase/dehydratase family protein [Brevundimonas lenta]MBB4082442.1 nucleoside-diphosphate-sugar epimerase [Brevundimonas lenta]
MTRRALVTGATGGLGLAVTAGLLEAGYKVRASGRRPEALERLRSMGAEVFAGDLLDGSLGAACEGMDVIFHAAALSSPWGSDEAFQRANVDLTRKLLRASQGAGADSFVFVSSPSVYARWRDQTGITEATPLPARPLNAYARTKREAELLVLAADEAGFRTVAVRPRAIVGPDDAVLLPRILRLVKSGRFPLFREGKALVELTDARDAARALMLADSHRERAGGHAVNVTSGRPLPVAELVQRLGEALGVDVRAVPVPLPLGQALSVASEAISRALPGKPEPVLTPYTLSTLAWSQTFDLTGARALLDYQPAHDAVETAMAVAPGLANG